MKDSNQNTSTKPNGMQDREGGYITIMVLLMMVVMMAMLLAVLSGSISSVKQAGGQSGLIQARAAAEAGQADGLYTLNQELVPQLNTMFTTYLRSFAQSGGNSTTTAIIPQSSWAGLINTLNAMNGTTISGNLSGSTTAASGSYSGAITFSNFRSDPISFTAQGQNYMVDYRITSNGTNKAYRREVVTSGTLRIGLGRQYINQFLLLADDGGSTGGNFYATGMNFDGPVQVNRNWRFAGSPRFAMGAKTAAATVQMYNCTTRTYQNVSTQTNGCTTPNWGGASLQYNAPAVNLPNNSFSQARGALGLDANDTSTVTNQQACGALGLSCTTAAPPNGVYMPASGGIYIQGNADIKMSIGTTGKQIYTITQGSAITTIEVTYPNGPTVLIPPTGSPKTQNRVPNGQIYVTGSVTSLTGPDRSGSLPTPLPTDGSTPSVIRPAVSKDSKINIAAAGDVTIQSDIVYEQNPNTVPGASNILGIISGTGNVKVGTSAPNDVYIQAALLAGASGKGFAADAYNSGAPRGSIHLLGSLAESTDPPRGVGNIASNGTVTINNGYGDAFNYDQRFLNGATAPPFFPSTTVFSAQTALPKEATWGER